MATWADPTGDLRRVLADSATDNFVKDQEPIGPRNASNRVFYVFNDRLTTSGRQSTLQTGFTQLHVYHENAEISASGVLVTDAERGEFHLMILPAATDQLRVSYHFQRHSDAELSAFLTQAIGLCNISNVSNTAAGLQMAVLYFAAALSHEREAQRWLWRKVDQFALHDSPQTEQATSRVTFHRDQADRFQKQALVYRKDYYDLRHDRGRAPAFGILKRTPADYRPRR